MGYRKITEGILKEQQEGYNTNVKVNFYPTDPTKRIDSVVVNISFNISIETRSYGIKSIYLYFSDIINVPYVEENIESGLTENKEVQIDLSNLQVEYIEGIYTVYNIDLFLDINGNVDYSKSVITCGYIKK